MVDMLGSGTFDEEGMSQIGISYSEVPTPSGPRYVGKYGTGLRLENIL